MTTQEPKQDPFASPALNPNTSLVSLDDVPLSARTTAADNDPNEKLDYASSNDPFSPFYSHPPTRTSLEQRKSESRVHIPLPGTSTSHVNLTQSNQSNAGPVPPLPSHLRNTNTTTNDSYGKEYGDQPCIKKASTMWPTPLLGKNGKRCQDKRKNLTGTLRGSRACAPYRRLSRKQRWMFQVFLALLIIGLGVGLGVGISRAVGAGVWKSNNSSYSIPESKR